MFISNTVCALQAMNQGRARVAQIFIHLDYRRPQISEPELSLCDAVNVHKRQIRHALFRLPIEVVVRHWQDDLDVIVFEQLPISHAHLAACE